MRARAFQGGLQLLRRLQQRPGRRSLVAHASGDFNDLANGIVRVAFSSAAQIQQGHECLASAERDQVAGTDTGSLDLLRSRHQHLGSPGPLRS
jgi:hypothetical protein